MTTKSTDLGLWVKFKATDAGHPCYEHDLCNFAEGEQGPLRKTGGKYWFDAQVLGNSEYKALKLFCEHTIDRIRLFQRANLEGITIQHIGEALSTRFGSYFENEIVRWFSYGPPLQHFLMPIMQEHLYKWRLEAFFCRRYQTNTEDLIRRGVVSCPTISDVAVTMLRAWSEEPWSGLSDLDRLNGIYFTRHLTVRTDPIPISSLSREEHDERLRAYAQLIEESELREAKRNEPEWYINGRFVG